MPGFASRLVRACKLDAKLYEEVEADRGAVSQAAVVVLLASLATGIPQVSALGGEELLFAAIEFLASWLLWSWGAYVAGANIIPEPQTRADIGELLRVIGFSNAPGLLRVVGILPAVGTLVYVGTGIWMLAAAVVGIRQALDYTSTWRALAVAAIGWGVHLAVWLLLGAMRSF